jgi:hypothetical protein
MGIWDPITLPSQMVTIIDKVVSQHIVRKSNKDRKHHSAKGKKDSKQTNENKIVMRIMISCLAECAGRAKKFEVALFVVSKRNAKEATMIKAI